MVKKASTTKKTPSVKNPGSIAKKPVAKGASKTKALEKVVKKKPEEDINIGSSSEEEESHPKFEYESSDEEEDDDKASKKLKVDLKAQKKKFEAGKAKAKEVAAAATQNESKSFGKNFSYESSDEEEEEKDEDKDADILVPENSKKPEDGSNEKKTKPPRGVLYIGRIPHGFYENEMRGYFEQFGTLTRVRVSRSKKTGRSRHYGYVEFESAEVAAIVADTMDNYLLFGHLLQVKPVPADKVTPELFWGGATVVPGKDGKPSTLRAANGKVFRAVASSEANWHSSDVGRAAQAAHNVPRSQAFWKGLESRAADRAQKTELKLAALGIKFSAPVPGSQAKAEEKEAVGAKKTTTKAKAKVTKATASPVSVRQTRSKTKKTAA